MQKKGEGGYPAETVAVFQSKIICSLYKGGIAKNSQRNTRHVANQYAPSDCRYNDNQ